MLLNLLRTQAINIPWPIYVSESKFESNGLRECALCVNKCGNQPRCSQYNVTGEGICEFGLSFYKLMCGGYEVLVYGIFCQSNTRGNRYVKNYIKGRSVTIDSLHAWADQLTGLLAACEDLFMARQTEMLDPLHDPIRMVKQIKTISNNLIIKHSLGDSLEQQIDNASQELKSLVKAAGLLYDSFELLTIYFNPDAASYGRKRAISIHGLVTMLIAILKIDDNGITKNESRIRFSGSSHRNCFAYDSFKLIPFALISNAIKYTMRGKIDVSITERRESIELSVASIGPLIEGSELREIFKKRIRGKWAAKLADEGRGVGLYLASVIADAHGFTINVISKNINERHNGIPMAMNQFSFEVPFQH